MIRLNFVALILLLVVTFSISVAFAQETTETEPSEAAETEEALPEALSGKLEPVFPKENPLLIHVEAEDAVSTNFAKQPTLNYGASGFRTLQLNRYTGLYGGAAFFAEFVFLVENPGSYEFWYGGTPPGPQEDLFPSFASPFRYQIDGGDLSPVYREEVKVADGYTPAFYWEASLRNYPMNTKMPPRMQLILRFQYC